MKRKKRRSAKAAVALFVIAASVAGRTFWTMSNGTAVAPRPAATIVEDPEMDTGSPSVAVAPITKWRDLLAEHGSFDGRSAVRTAFAILDEARVAPPAPVGETIAPSYWEGEDPPELELGVVMISSRSRRAVLGSKVVGIGDEHAGVVVHGIERDRIVTRWGHTVLTYDLEDGWPREFRPERARRAHAAAEASAEGAEVREGESTVVVDPEARVPGNGPTRNGQESRK